MIAWWICTIVNKRTNKLSGTPLPPPQNIWNITSGEEKKESCRVQILARVVLTFHATWNKKKEGICVENQRHPHDMNTGTSHHCVVYAVTRKPCGAGNRVEQWRSQPLAMKLQRCKSVISSFIHQWNTWLKTLASSKLKSKNHCSIQFGADSPTSGPKQAISVYDVP